MTKPIIFMFSGQGSQYYQMGQALYEENPIFRYWMQEADALSQDLGGQSIIDVLYHSQHKKSDPFTRTLLTHPAIFITEYAVAQMLLSQGIIPHYVLGASLGEFAAAVVAGILSFEEALKAVIHHAQILEKYSLPGGMVAIMDSPTLYDKTPLMREKSELAAINFPSHFVISGTLNNLKQISILLKENHIVTQDLAVSHGFHSFLMDEAASPYLRFLEKYSLKSPHLPFISCAHKGPLKMISSSHFWEAARQPIYFQETIEILEKENNFFYLDLGPSGTLATFVKYNLKEASSSQSFALLTPFGNDLKNLTNLSRGLSL